MALLKSLSPIIIWLMRLSLIALLAFLNWTKLSTFHFNHVDSYFALIKILLAATLFLGGILNKNSLTVFASLLISLCLIYDTYHTFQGLNSRFFTDMLIISSALFFTTNGNRN